MPKSPLRLETDMELHIKKKRYEMDIKTKKMYWLIGRMAPTTLENNILIYKNIIRPIWAYGIELWGCSCKSNVNIIQRFQSKFLRTITNAPRYISNKSLQDDLQIQYVSEIINKKASKHFQKLALHPNQSVTSLCLYPEARILKRKWP